MRIELEVPEIRAGLMTLAWEPGFTIASQRLTDDSVVIEANAAGLVSLARHLLALAQENVPDYYHFHLDDCNSLEEGSVHLMFTRRNDFGASGATPLA